MVLNDDRLAQYCEQMSLALTVAENCSDIEWYGVGCSIVDSTNRVISTGYTGEMREQGKMRHAEDVAICKALAQGFDLSKKDITLYSTLEPCSIRASGKTPCCERIIRVGIRKVVYGAKEPYDEALGIVCRGDSTLRNSGIEVLHLASMQDICLKSAISKRILDQSIER